MDGNCRIHNLFLLLFFPHVLYKHLGKLDGFLGHSENLSILHYVIHMGYVEIVALLLCKDNIESKRDSTDIPLRS